MRSLDKIIFFCFLFFASSVHARLGLPNLLEQVERPSIPQLEEMDPGEVTRFLGGEVLETPQETNIFALYELIIRELLKTPDDLPIFIFARDGEGLYDSIQAGAPSSLRDRVKLVNISRPVAATHNSPLVLKALRKMGMPVDAILSCRQRMMWLDTGTRGSIYLNLFNHLFSSVSGNPQQRSHVIRCLVENIEAKMIVARSANLAGQFYQYLRNGGDVTPPVLLSQMHAQFYFSEIPQAGRNKIGIPPGEHEKWQWITQNVEYLPKWDGRATGLTPTGDVIINIEPREVSRVNKEAYLRHQIKLLRHFSEFRPREEEVEEPVIVKPVAMRAPRGRAEIAEEIDVAKLMTVENVKALAHSVRHDPDPAESLRILAAISRDPAGSKFLIESLYSSRQFAHVVYRHTDIFSEKFLKAYRKKVDAKGLTGSHQRAIEACIKFLGEAS